MDRSISKCLSINTLKKKLKRAKKGLELVETADLVVDDISWKENTFQEVCTFDTFSYYFLWLLLFVRSIRIKIKFD